MIPKIERFFLTVSPPVVGVMVLVTLWAIFFWVPTDAGLGISQRIFYYHVPAATTSFAGFIGDRLQEARRFEAASAKDPHRRRE